MYCKVFKVISESTEQCEATGYRLINLESLSSVLSEAHECEEGEK